MASTAAEPALPTQNSDSRAATAAERERKRIVDTVGLLGVVLIVAAVAVPWFLRLLDIPMAPLAWTAALYAAAYILAAAATDKLRTTAGLDRAMSALQLSQAVLIAILWHLAGGIDNPGFLLAFFLPVATSGLTLGRWQPFAVAGVSTTLVFSIAVAESAGLRWQLERLGMPSLASLEALSDWLPTRPRPFPHLDSEPAFQLVLLSLFAALLLADAFLSRSLSSVLVRLASRLSASQRHLAEVRGLFQAVLHAAPDPGLVVYADSGQILHASKSFADQMLVDPSALAGRTVYDVVRFAQPARLEELMRGGGDAPFLAYHVGPEVRIANLSARHVDHAGHRYIYLAWHDLTEHYYLQAAFDASEDPILIVGPNEQVLYANRGAEDAFGALYFGKDVSGFLAVDGMAERWWREPHGQLDPVRVELAGRRYRVACQQVPLPGEAEGAAILSLRDLEKELSRAEVAEVDPLTGAHQKPHLERALRERELPVAVAVLDLDDFASIGEDLGSEAADAALRHFVRVTLTELHASDALVRLDRDEFAILFGGVEPAEASLAIDRIHRRIRRTPLTVQDAVRILDFSAGVVSCRPGESADAILERGRTLMQQAKREGKGSCRVEI